MGEKEFIALCKKTVSEYAKCSQDEVFIVWMCKTLQNSKAMVSTTIPDGMYYELTYNGNDRELYMDAYKKEHNLVIII